MVKRSSCVIILLCAFVTCANALSYQVLYHDIYNVPARKYVFKIIKFDKPEDAIEDWYTLVGEAHVADYDFSIYILTAEDFEVFTSGETPEHAYFWHKKVVNKRILLETGALNQLMDLEFGEKYYLVLDNTYSILQDKKVVLLLLALYEGGRG